MAINDEERGSLKGLCQRGTRLELKGGETGYFIRKPKGGIKDSFIMNMDDGKQCMRTYQSIVRIISGAKPQKD